MRVLNRRFGSVRVVPIALAPNAVGLTEQELRDELARTVQRLSTRVEREDATRAHLRAQGALIGEGYTPETIALQLRAHRLRSALEQLHAGDEAAAADLAHTLVETEPC